MVQAFQHHIAHYNLFAKNDRILVAVSGGRDSMVLAHLFLQAGYRIGLAHANFLLRGAASEADAKLVTTWAEENGVPCWVERFDTLAYAKPLGISTQMAARTLRYTWFDRLRQKEGFQVVATAHHRQDALESVILNLSRGTGHAGMAGMTAKSEWRVRPLLFATRDQITAYAKAEGIPWREDASNAETKYRRNFIRHEVIPQLETLNPNLLDTFGATWERLHGASELLTHFLDSWLTSALRIEGRDSYLSLAALQALPAPEMVLYQWLQTYGYRYVQVQEVVASLRGISGKYWDGKRHRLQLDRESLVLSPLPEERKALPWPEEMDTLEFAEGTLNRATRKGSGTWPEGATIACLNPDRLRGPWTVRPWRKGDWFVPLGMQGKKKLSDFLIDSKIPLNLKNRVWVLVVGEDIAWVIGHRIDDRFKAASPHDTVIEISWTPT